MRAGQTLSDYVELVSDEGNPRRPNIYSLLECTTLPESLAERFECGGERKFLYPLVFDTMLNVPGILKTLKDPVVAAVQDGRGVIVLDDSCEGPPLAENAVTQIATIARELNFPPDALVIINHNMDYGRWMDGWAARHGAGLHRPLSVYYHSWVVSVTEMLAGLRRKDTQLIGPMFPDPDSLEQHIERQLGGRIGDRAAGNKQFLAMNFAARTHRILLMLDLIDRDILSRGEVSFGGVGRKLSPATVEAQREELAYFFQWSRLKRHWDALTAMGPLTLPGGDRPHDPSGGSLILDFDFEAHRRTAFSVVTESDFTARGLRRITEKSLKPLIGLHPFITIGLPGTLRTLRQLGFKTFDGLINEDYDAAFDAEIRFELATQEIHRLATMDRRATDLFLYEAAPALIHNARHVVFGLPAVLRETMVLPALEALEGITRKPAAL